MHGRDRWKHAGELNVYQIALLLAERDPTPYQDTPYHNWDSEARDDAAPYLTALKNAVTTERLETLTKPWRDHGIGHDWSELLIDVEKLKIWLRDRNFTDNFFFQSKNIIQIHTISSSPYYAPKLAAALAAWQAVTSEPTRLRGKSPKQALDAWLIEHAAEYSLVKPDGTLNKAGIEEVAKVANWQPSGGAPKTPS